MSLLETAIACQRGAIVRGSRALSTVGDRWRRPRRRPEAGPAPFAAGAGLPCPRRGPRGFRAPAGRPLRRTGARRRAAPHAQGMPAIARRSASRSMRSGRNGQACLATAGVRSGSLRRGLRAVRRASARAPAWTAAATTIRSPQNEAGKASTPLCAHKAPRRNGRREVGAADTDEGGMPQRIKRHHLPEPARAGSDPTVRQTSKLWDDGT